MTRSEILQGIAERGEAFVRMHDCQTLFGTRTSSLGGLWRTRMDEFCEEHKLYVQHHMLDNVLSGYLFKPRYESALDYAARARTLAGPEVKACEHGLVGQCDLCSAEQPAGQERVEPAIEVYEQRDPNAWMEPDETWGRGRRMTLPPRMVEEEVHPDAMLLTAMQLVEGLDRMNQVLDDDPEAVEVEFTGTKAELQASIGFQREVPDIQLTVDELHDRLGYERNRRRDAEASVIGYRNQLVEAEERIALVRAAALGDAAVSQVIDLGQVMDAMREERDRHAREIEGGGDQLAEAWRQANDLTQELEALKRKLAMQGKLFEKIELSWDGARVVARVQVRMPDLTTRWVQVSGWGFSHLQRAMEISWAEIERAIALMEEEA